MISRTRKHKAKSSISV